MGVDGADNPSGGAVTKGSAIAVTWSRLVLDIAIGMNNFDQQDFLFAVLDDGTVWHYPEPVSQQVARFAMALPKSPSSMVQSSSQQGLADACT